MSSASASGAATSSLCLRAGNGGDGSESPLRQYFFLCHGGLQSSLRCCMLQAAASLRACRAETAVSTVFVVVVVVDLLLGRPTTSQETPTPTAPLVARRGFQQRTQMIPICPAMRRHHSINNCGIGRQFFGRQHNRAGRCQSPGVSAHHAAFQAPRAMHLQSLQYTTEHRDTR